MTQRSPLPLVTGRRLRAAIYARYSPGPDQKQSSIDDQLRDDRALAARLDCDVVAEFRDAAVSGADLAKPDWLRMMDLARAGGFDVLVSESLSRLGRDLEEQAGVYKRLTFLRIPIVTVGEGTITLMHVGMKGTFNAMQLTDMALQVRRGQRGRIEKGRAAGGIAYGYRKVRILDAHGEFERGVREIDPDQAAIILRIFTEAAEGKSASTIARDLNREGIRPMRGRLWRPSTITGHRARGMGILVNELYIGRLIYNRTRQERDPDTNRHVDRVNPRAEWVSAEAPELRIVSQDLWDRCQARTARAAAKPLHQRRRRHHLLSGLVVCSGCDADFIIIDNDRMGCSTHRDGGACANGKRISRRELESRVLTGLRDKLMAPELLREFIAEWHAAGADQRQQIRTARGIAEREIAGVERQIARLVDAIVEGTDTPAMRTRLRDLESQKRTLDAAIAADKRSAEVIELHPKLPEIYRAKVDRLAEALNDPLECPEAIRALRGLVEKIVIQPGAGWVRTAVLHARPDGFFAFANETETSAPKQGLLVASPRERRQEPLISEVAFPALVIAI